MVSPAFGPEENRSTCWDINWTQCHSFLRLLDQIDWYMLQTVCIVSRAEPHFILTRSLPAFASSILTPWLCTKPSGLLPSLSNNQLDCTYSKTKKLMFLYKFSSANQQAALSTMSSYRALRVKHSRLSTLMMKSPLLQSMRAMKETWTLPSRLHGGL